MRYGVFGGGSWGTALAHHLARAGREVILWAREPEVVDGIAANRRNPLFLEDMDLDQRIGVSADVEEVARASRVWVWVVPVQHSRDVMQQLTGAVRSDVTTGVRLQRRRDRYVAAHGRAGLGGAEHTWEPLLLSVRATFAREVILGHPSAAVLACADLWLAQQLQSELSDRHLRVYASTDRSVWSWQGPSRTSSRSRRGWWTVSGTARTPARRS